MVTVTKSSEIYLYNFNVNYYPIMKLLNIWKQEFHFLGMIW